MAMMAGVGGGSAKARMGVGDGSTPGVDSSVALVITLVRAGTLVGWIAAGAGGAGVESADMSFGMRMVLAKLTKTTRTAQPKPTEISNSSAL